MNTSKTEKTRGTATSPETRSGEAPISGSSVEREFGSNPDASTADRRSRESGLGSTAGAVASEAASTAKKTARVAKEHAADLASHLGRDISAMAEDQKNRGVETVRTFAKAMNTAASEIEKESPTVASFMRDAANQVEGFSDRLRERSAQDLWSSATDAARSQPVLFFAGAVVAGFALARFLKSGAEHRQYRAASTYPETYGESPAMRSGAGSYAAPTSPGPYGAGASPAGQTAGRSTATGSAGMSSGSSGMQQREGGHGRT